MKITVPGNPKALKRHRSTKLGHQYDPSVGDKADFLTLCVQQRPGKPFDEPLHIELWFYFSRPRAHYRTGKYSNILKDNAPDWHTTKPDATNLAKLVEDALNGIFWRDDSVICSLLTIKKYSDTPRTEILIKRLSDVEYCK